MPDRWVPDKKGEEILLENLASGFDAWVQVVEDRIKDVERSQERYHFTSATRPRSVHYVDTIEHATYLNGALVGGKNVRGASRPKGDTIHARVYTTSFLGHMLEVTGAKPHEIPIFVAPGIFVIVQHPGFAPRRHFVPGLLLAVASVGATMQARITARQGAQGSHPMPRTFVGNE